MSDQTPGTPQNPPAEPPAQPAVQPPAPAPEQPAAPAPAPAQPAAPAPAPAQPAPVAAQPTPPPAQPAAPAAAPAAAAPVAAAAAPVVPPPAYAPAPAAPGGPVPPGYAPAPPPGGGGIFKSGKNKTIALIVGGVIAVGTIGGIAALLAGGGDDSKEVSTTAAAPEGSGVLDPAPVGSTDPATPDPAEPTESGEPTEAPSEPAEETTAPAPDPEPQPASGDAVTIGGNIAVPVPTGWKVLGTGDSDVAMSDGGANYVYVVTGTVKPSADAGQVLMNSLESILPPDQYPDLATSDVVPQTPGGSIVSLALLEYEATWTDGQGTTPVHGAVFSAVRQDGTALIMLGEHTPPKEFGDIYSTELQPVLDAILLPFAGVG